MPGFFSSVSAAMAGHLNVVLNADLDGREEVNTSGNNAIIGNPDGRGEIYVFGIDASADGRQATQWRGARPTRLRVTRRRAAAVQPAPALAPESSRW
jgi:hypothetical protein